MTSSADQSLRKHVRHVILTRLAGETQSRQEALADFFSLTLPGSPESHVRHMAKLVPPLLPKLYDKWVGLFLERFFETVPHNQIDLLCDGSEENNATLVLIYLMFLESERMEKQRDEDLAAYGLKMTGCDEQGDLAANYLRAKMQKIGQSIKDKEKKPGKP